MIHQLTEHGFSVYVLDEFEDRAANEGAIYENFEKR